LSILNAGVIGAGRSGIAAARLLKRQGARVLLSDAGHVRLKGLAGISLEQGGHSDRLLRMDLLVRSPGVPDHLPILQKARKRRIPIISELELASRYCHPQLTVAITGTNGKTTTTALVGKLFSSTGRHTLVGGNIGTPLAELAPRVKRSSTVILEVSSYQLENVERFHANIAAILNITPDHLEHHGTMEAYAAAKARIFENQTPSDITVLNADDPWCRRLARKCPGQIFWFSRRKRLTRGVFFHHGAIHLHWKSWKLSWPLKTRLPGPHNVENILAAVAMAVAGNVPVPKIREVLETFPGVEHRLEDVRTLKGVRYVNDSKGTNVDSTRVALEAFAEPLIVIMGGQGKGSPYAPLSGLVKKRVKHLIFIGEDTPRLRKELGSLTSSIACQTMIRAVSKARDLASPGDIVLLSPACASFDQYKNYEERGRHFKLLVRRLR